MLPHYEEAKGRLLQFIDRYGLELRDELGGGWDGVVFATSAPTAVKAFRHEELYRNELAVYHRLRERKVRLVREFQVPRLLRGDDEFWVIEMSWVTPPFVLDFACAYLDREPPYANDPEVMGPWLAEKREQFGDDWSEVRAVIAEFRRMGIHLSDIKPGNIQFKQPKT